MLIYVELWMFRNSAKSGVVSLVTELPVCVGNVGSVSRVRQWCAICVASALPFEWRYL